MLRFAPSPSGEMTIGDLRTALVNYLVAQQRSDGFIVRIADINKAETIEGKDTEIMQILEKFALIHTSVFHQSEHLHMHQTLAIKLLEEGKAFVCTCTQEEYAQENASAKVNKQSYPCLGDCEQLDKSEYARLKTSGEPFVIRLKKPSHDIVYHDLLRGKICTPADDMDASVILHTDTTPSYNFACACDDMLSGVTTIICDESSPENTPEQIHIKTALNYDEKTEYLHLPNYIDKKGKKISKSDDGFLLKWLFKEGFVPDAIINYLLLLDAPYAPQEIFTLPEAIEWFNINHIPSSAVIFDIEKLRAINREHLRRMDDKILSTLFGFADADIGKLAKLYLEDASTVKELSTKIDAIFAPKNFQGTWAKQMRTMETLIQNAPMFSDFSAFESYLLKESGLQGKAFFKALRLLLTGAEDGPELSDIYPFIKSYIMEIAS